VILGLYEELKSRNGEDTEQEIKRVTQVGVKYLSSEQTVAALITFEVTA
jgi:hypothetical protein